MIKYFSNFYLIISSLKELAINLSSFTKKANHQLIVLIFFQLFGKILVFTTFENKGSLALIEIDFNKFLIEIFPFLILESLLDIQVLAKGAAYDAVEFLF